MPAKIKEITVTDFLSILLGEVEENLKEQHKHICPDCGFVWRHSAEDIYDAEKSLGLRAGKEVHDNAHTCPCCKKGESWDWYEGHKPAVVHYYGQPEFTLSGAPDISETAPDKTDEVEIFVRMSNCYSAI